MPTPTDDPIARLISRLDVEPQGDDIFVARTEDDEGRAFGGELIAQATVAAGRTCDERALHSLHAYFLRPGRPDTPTRLRVERMRDGRTFASRRVYVEQDDRTICDVTLSFSRPSSGINYQEPMPEVPAPETLPTSEELARATGWPEPPAMPFDWRHVDRPWEPLQPGEPPWWRVWMAPRTPLPDDDLLHLAAIVYYSDAGSLGAVERRFGEFDWQHSASLDHALWMHRPVRWDDFMLMVTESHVGADGRALTHRTMYRRDGALVATIAQEAIFRPKE